MKKMLVGLLVGCSLMMGCSNVNAEMIGEGNTPVKKSKIFQKIYTIDTLKAEYGDIEILMNN